MFVLSTLLTSLAQVVDVALELYMWVVIARAVISWVNPDPYNPIVRFLCQLTDPVLYRLNRMVPMIVGGIDLSPIVLIFIIQFLRSFLVRTLLHFAAILLR